MNGRVRRVLWASGIIAIGSLAVYFAIPRPLARYGFLKDLNPVFEEMHLPIVHPDRTLPNHDPKQWVFRFDATRKEDIIKLLKARLPALGFTHNVAGTSPDEVLRFRQPNHPQGETVSVLTGSDAVGYACSMTDPDHPKDERTALRAGYCVVVVETEDTWLEDQVRVLSYRLGLK